MIKRLFFLLALSGMATFAMAQTPDQESTLKAVFIYNFTRYIDWGNDTDNNDFVIGIIGTTPVENALAEIAKTSTVKNKKIVLKHFTKAEEIDYCQIIFISKNALLPLTEILAKTGKGTLTISEQAGFASQGTAFNFFPANDKIKFEANLKSIYSAGLKASSQLLKLATIID